MEKIKITTTDWFLADPEEMFAMISSKEELQAIINEANSIICKSIEIANIGGWSFELDRSTIEAIAREKGKEMEWETIQEDHGVDIGPWWTTVIGTARKRKSVPKLEFCAESAEMLFYNLKNSGSCWSYRFRDAE